MRVEVDFKDMQDGDILVTASGEYPIKMGGVRLPSLIRWLVFKEDLALYGGRIEREVPQTFTCQATVITPGSICCVSEPTLLLSGVSQVVPTGQVEVSIKHVTPEGVS